MLEHVELPTNDAMIAAAIRAAIAQGNSFTFTNGGVPVVDVVSHAQAVDEHIAYEKRRMATQHLLQLRESTQKVPMDELLSMIHEGRRV